MLEAGPWLGDNLRIPFAYFVAHWAWILGVSLFGFAVSSRVRYAAVARGVMLAVVLVGSGTGAILNQLTRTSIGDLIRLPKAIDSVAMTMLGGPSPDGLSVFFNWLSLAALAVLSLWILNRRTQSVRGGGVSSSRIVFREVSKFYGEVLGVNRVDLGLEPGLTGLVGPNGSGKSTLMNLMTGLLQPGPGNGRSPRHRHREP